MAIPSRAVETFTKDLITCRLVAPRDYFYLKSFDDQSNKNLYFTFPLPHHLSHFKIRSSEICCPKVLQRLLETLPTLALQVEDIRV